MPASNPHARKPAAFDRANPALCASAASRLIWAAGALCVLWATIRWALS